MCQFCVCHSIEAVTVYGKTFEGEIFRGFHDFFSTVNVLCQIVYWQ